MTIDERVKRCYAFIREFNKDFCHVKGHSIATLQLHIPTTTVMYYRGIDGLWMTAGDVYYDPSAEDPSDYVPIMAGVLFRTRTPTRQQRADVYQRFENAGLL